jgi:hypothetical protein
MQSDNLHLSEHDLVLAADGELPRTAKSAGNCASGNLLVLPGAHAVAAEYIADFVRARNRQLNKQLPLVAGPRALLRARLAEAASSPASFGASPFGTFSFQRRQ